MQMKQVFDSRIFRVERLTYQATNGAQINRDVVRHPGSVAIVPILSTGDICLIKNHRVSVDETLIEIPAGTLEPPESPLDCAHRELAEETGFRATKVEAITSFYPAPGILDEKMHLYVARGLVEGEPQRETGEEIENFIVSRSEARRMIQSGTIRDAKTILGILLTGS